jgi:hypothetical protein
MPLPASINKALRAGFTLLVLAALFLPATSSGEEIATDVFLLAREDRLLAFSGQRNRWFTVDLRPGETVVKSSHGGNVAVASTGERALAFSALTGRWSEESFRIRETVESVSAEGNIGTVVTNIRALGFSASTGAWVESRFSLGK